jgi:steroid 5-alpha reductase family enzyme
MMPAAALLSLILTISVFFALWLISLRTRNASIADVYWGPGFVVITSVTLITNGTFGTNQIAFASLVGLWGLRLGFHLWFRHRAAHSEDRRYALMRERGGENWPLKSLFTVFMVQAIIQWLIALPIQLALSPSAIAAPGLMELIDLTSLPTFALTRFRPELMLLKWINIAPHIISTLLLLSGILLTVKGGWLAGDYTWIEIEQDD